MLTARPRFDPAIPDSAKPDVAADDRALHVLQTLKGHSGADVVLGLREGRSLVRKTAGASAQNARLEGQAEKQRVLLAHGLPLPRILSQGLDAAGRAFIEMEYVPARTAASVVVDGTAFPTDLVIAALERALTLFRLTESEALAPEVFQRKIEEIIIKTAHGAGDRLGAAVDAMGRTLLNLPWSGIPSSACHGDLTLENILIGQRNGVVFIDCDEPFASSSWLDVAKLCQDVDGHWCLRHLYLESPEALALVHAVERLHRLRPFLRALAARTTPGFEAFRPQLTALNLFRTLPYTKDTHQIAFVLDRMRVVLAAPGM